MRLVFVCLLNACAHPWGPESRKLILSLYRPYNAIMRCSNKFTAVFCIYTKCGRIHRASRCFDHPSHSGDFRLWWFGAQDHECWTWNFELNGQNFKVLSWFTVTNLLNFEACLKFMKSSMFLKKNLFHQ